MLPGWAMRLEKQFGTNVRRWRKKCGLSQEELADRAGLHPTYVSGIETGYRNPTVKIVGRIAEALEIEPADLFRIDADSDE
jgi:transcriptional regulator with XRE-family HTH domain